MLILREFHKQTKTYRERGMTLVEVIAVVVIIGLIMAVFAKNIFGTSSMAKWNLNKTKMEKLQQTLGMYKLQYNQYPNSLDELRTGSADAKKRGFVSMATEEDLQDVWGFDFIYKTGNKGRTFTLGSNGSDGAPGGDGDKQDFSLESQ